MQSDWIPLSQIANIVGGFAFKSQDFATEGFPVVKIANIEPPNVNIESCDRIPVEKTTGLERFLLKDKDIVMAMTGATVGKVGRARSNERIYVNQRVAKISAKMGREFDDYIYALLSQPNFDEQVINNSSGSAQANVSADGIGRILVPNFSPSEQISIGRIIGSLDDKIELNRRTNATLESLAQTLFRAWFVDFEPVKANAAGVLPSGMDAQTAALFPSEFEQSTLGLIPKGWEVVSLSDIAQTTIGGDWGDDESSDKNNVCVICLRGTDLESLRWTGEALRAPLRWISSSSLTKRALNECDVLIGGSGAGPCGKPFWGFSQFQNQFDYPVIYSNFVKRFRARTVAQACFVDRVLQTMKESGEMDNFINGTSVPNLNDKQLLTTKKVALPPEGILEAYLDFIRPVQARLFSGENANLSAIRDTLLPRLISGRLRVPEAMRAVEAHA